MRAKTQNVDFRDIRVMPFYWVHRALISVVKPTWRGLAAYHALAYFVVTERGVCSVSLKDLCDAAGGVSQDTMRRGLAELVKLKVLAIKPRWKTRNTKTGAGRQQLANEYLLLDLSKPLPI